MNLKKILVWCFVIGLILVITAENSNVGPQAAGIVSNIFDRLGNGADEIMAFFNGLF